MGATSQNGPLLRNQEKTFTFLSVVLYTLLLFHFSHAQTTTSNQTYAVSVAQPESSPSPSPLSSSPPPPNVSLSVTSPGDPDVNITSPLNSNITTSAPVITTLSQININTTVGASSIATQAINGPDAITDPDLNTTTETIFTTTVLGENATLSTSTASPAEGKTNSSSGQTLNSSSVAGTSGFPQDTNTMETTASYVTSAMNVTDGNSTYWVVTSENESDEVAFIRLIIIAGATAGSCVVLFLVTFLIIFCFHRKQQQRKNARYYEFKKKSFKAKYEKVEQKSSLARREKEPETPIGPGWVFNTSGHHGDYEDDVGQNVALRSILPLGGVVPQLKLNFHDEQNGPPDSGHGGSIAPDDSALGVSASLEEEMEEFDLNPLYMGLGTSVGTGSEARDHSYIGGDSDTISEGNEPIASNPIRDVQFNSFGANGRIASEEAVEL